MSHPAHSSRLAREDEEAHPFVQRYRWLLGWALKLTGNRTEAEDLLQSGFVQFTLYRPDTSAIQDLDGYLYTLLKNLRLTQVRRRARLREEPLGVIDFDSVEELLRVVDPGESVRVADDLRAVCRYGCERKETSKSGSVLLLRYFLGFFPSEIALILNTSSQGVYEWLQLARREARAALEQPVKVVPLRQPVPARGSVPADHVLLSELQTQIRAHESGLCLSREDWQQRYAAEQAVPDAALLAHLVSCVTCLRHVCEIHGLAPPEDHDPFDSLGRERRPRRLDSSGGRSEPPLRRWRRALRAVTEAEPAELHICVNGWPVGLLLVNSARNEAAMQARCDEPIGFIEVRTERDLLLFLVPVDPPPAGPPVASAAVTFAAGRSLHVMVDFTSAWPIVRVTYERDCREEVSRVSPARSPRVQDDETDQRPARGWLTRLMPRWVLAPVGALVLAAAGFAGWGWLAPPPLSAAELLLQTRQNERRLVSMDPSGVVRRAFAFESRLLPAGPVTRRRVEMWQEPKGRRARRVFDESNRLVGGEWTAHDGGRLVYTAAAGALRQEPPGGERDFHPDTAWRWEPAAELFESLVPDVKQLKVIDETETIAILTTTAAASAGAARPRIHEAQLRVSKATGLPVEQRLVVEEVLGLFEYRYVETAFERLPLGPHVEVFDPDPGLSPRAVSEADSARTDAPSRPTVSLPFDRIELEVTYSLHRLQECVLRRSARVRRLPGGLALQLTPTSRECAGRLRHAFTGRPGIARLDLAEARSDPSQTPSPLVGFPEAQVQETPAGRVFGETLARRAAALATSVSVDLGPEIRTQFRELYARMHARLERLEVSRNGLTELSTRWPLATLRGFDLDTIAKWQALARDYARAIEQESEGILAELGLVPDHTVEQRPDAAVPLGLADVVRRIARMEELDAGMRTSVGRFFTRAIPEDDEALAQELAGALRQLHGIARELGEPWLLAAPERR